MRRPCKTCGRNRAERFYVSSRGRVCSDCRKAKRRLTARQQHLLKTYGITADEYDAIVEAQGGGCGVCGGRRSYFLQIDHDHALERAGVPIRKCVRGATCRRCNKRLLPAARDSIEVLESAIAYLREPPARKVLHARQGADNG